MKVVVFVDAVNITIFCLCLCSLDSLHLFSAVLWTACLFPLCSGGLPFNDTFIAAFMHTQSARPFLPFSVHLCLFARCFESKAIDSGLRLWTYEQESTLTHTQSKYIFSFVFESLS